MIRAVVAGAAGRMGRCNLRAVQESEDFELSGAFEAAGHAAVGKDAGALAGVEETGGVCAVVYDAWNGSLAPA